jgi:hypothetical protein
MNQRVGKYLVNLSLVSLLLFLNVRESREQDLVSGLLGSLLANGVTSLGSEFMHLKPSAENDGGQQQQQQQPGHSSGIMGWFSHLPGLQAFSNSGGIFSMMMNKMKSLFGGQKGSAGSDSSSVGGILSESVANSIVHDFQRIYIL